MGKCQTFELESRLFIQLNSRRQVIVSSTTNDQFNVVLLHNKYLFSNQSITYATCHGSSISIQVIRNISFSTHLNSRQIIQYIKYFFSKHLTVITSFSLLSWTIDLNRSHKNYHE